MAAALGLLTGLGLNAASGYAKEKVEQKHQHDSALFDFYSKNPQLVADSPEAQKFVTRYAGPEAGQAFIGMAGHVKQASQMFGQQVMGQGAAPTAGQPQAGGQPQPQGQPAQAEMTQPQHFYDLADQGEKYLASPDAQYLNDTQRKQGEEHIKYLRERGKEMETEAQRKQYESPEAKAEAKTKETQAELDVKNSPANVRAQAGTAATVGAARAGAEARAKQAPDIVAKQVDEARQKAEADAKARLGVNASPQAIKLAGDKAAAEATARAKATEGKAADPEVEANRRATRYNGMLTSYMKLNPPPTNWTGVVRKDMQSPEGRKYLQGFSQHLGEHGMGPNGELFQATATGPNGQKKAFYDGAWHDL